MCKKVFVAYVLLTLLIMIQSVTAQQADQISFWVTLSNGPRVEVKEIQAFKEVYIAYCPKYAQPWQEIYSSGRITTELGCKLFLNNTKNKETCKAKTAHLTLTEDPWFFTIEACLQKGNVPDERIPVIITAIYEPQ